MCIRNLFIVGLMAWCGALSLHADTISVNFNNGGATLLDPTDEVGFVPATNWNNFRNNGGLGLFNPDGTFVVDSNGVESDAMISWEVGASFFNSNNGLGNQRMMEGWFGLNEGDDGYIRFDDLPTTFTEPTYDAYVYFDSDRIAPDERTMTFTVNDTTTLVGTEMPANFGGTLFEATDGGAGHYVVFRDLNDPSFVLTADSDEGRAAITGIQLTTLPEPEPNLPPDPNAAVNVYNAATAGNTDTSFIDEAGTANWSMVGVERVGVDSSNTSITSAYRLVEPLAGVGGDNAPYPGGDTSFELWVRPGETEDTDEHQVVFETGGGQNGTSVLVREDAVRVLNSRLNERGFDIEVPLAGIDTSDFVQIVTTLDSVAGEIEVTVNGSAGGTASESAEGVVGRGGNRASLFTWGSGHANSGNPEDAPGGTFNLGGRTELEDMSPELLTQFTGDIALMNVYTRVISAEEIQASFDSITSGAMPGDYNANGMLDVEDINTLSAAVRDASTEGRFDLDGNGAVDDADREFWVVELKNTWFGDSNLDGQFDSADFVAVFSAGEFEDDVALNSNWETGDWNGDGDFTTNDFVTAFQGGGYEQGVRAATSAVPEPTGILPALLGFGLVGWIRRSRS